jgi:hypothetical protein
MENFPPAFPVIENGLLKMPNISQASLNQWLF